MTLVYTDFEIVRNPPEAAKAQVLGAQNLLVTLWVRDYLKVQAYERELADRAPGSAVISRQAVVRTFKRLGHVLDESGCSRSVVPLLLWTKSL
jgi:hypothetical protein